MKGSSVVTGKRGEFMVIGKILEKGLTVYTPIADVEGIDCIIKNDKGRLIEIQIKTRNKREENNKNFLVKEFHPHTNFFVCCYMIDTDELWMIPSFLFYKISVLNSYGNRVLSMGMNQMRELSKYKDDLGLELLNLGELEMQIHAKNSYWVRKRKG